MNKTFPAISIACGVLLNAAVYALSVALPPGSAAGALYAAAVLPGLAFSSRAYIIPTAATATVFALLGCLRPLPNAPQWLAFANAALTVSGIWAAAFFSISFLKKSEALAGDYRRRVEIDEHMQKLIIDLDNEIEHRIEERYRELVTANEHMKQFIIELDKNETLLHAIIANTVDAIVTIDEAGIVRSWNKRGESLFGYAEREIIGENVSLLMPEPYYSEHDGYLRRYLETGKAKIIGFGREVAGKRKDGTVFPLSLAVSEMIFEGKKIFIGIMRDISAQKAAERQKEALLEDLTKANQYLNEFAYVVSHDLKAPLRGISSLAGWIAEDYSAVLDDPGREQLKLLMERTQRMHNLIEGILSYSRIGRDRPEAERLDCAQLVSAVIDSLAPPENISVRAEGPFPVVVYYRTHLNQLLQNLVANAIKYLGKPAGEVVVTCADRDGFWEFCVRDNGVGIEEKHFERIFKIFQTLRPRDDGAGTGIGLALVKKIAETHGGKAWVLSQPGEGSAFYFTIPKQLKDKS